MPDDRLKVTSLRRLATRDGEAFTAVLRLDRARVGTVDNDGGGGATMYHAKRPDVFGWRHLEQFVSQCRHRGGPVSEEFVLDCLVDEYDLARLVTRAVRTGGTLVRLVDAHGHCVAVIAVAVATVAQRADLARRLVNHPISVHGTVWQIWTATTWRTFTGVPATPSA